LSVRIADDGSLGLDQTGPIPVALLQPQTAAAKVLEALRKAGIDVPDLTVSLKTDYGEAISVAGAVANSLRVRLGKSTTLAWLLAEAVPLSEADLDEIRIYRRDGTKRIVSSTDDVLVHDGDFVEVPFSNGASDVVVAGGVVKPLSLRFARGMTVGDALSAAGGIAGIGDPSRVTLTRRGEIMPLAWPEDSGMRLRPGETVRVDLRPDRRYVVVTGDVPHPGLVDYAPGMTATQAIEAAGGVTKDEAKEMVSVRNYLASVKAPVRLSWPFLKAMRIPDPVLAPDQIVEVSKAK
jgi:protein involved in polysaccharide export with SLBB domain